MFMNYWEGKDIKKWALNALRILTLFWFVGHFALTLVYVLPDNPVKDTLQPLLYETIETYFPQNWKLFAPDPISSDFALFVRPLSKSEYKIAQAKGLPSDGWYDLSSPLWADNQNNRFSAYERLSRPLTRTILSYLKDPQQQPVDILINAASAFCKDIGQKNADYIALVIHERESRPWFARGTSVPRAISTTLIGIYPINKNVENADIYRQN